MNQFENDFLTMLESVKADAVLCVAHTFQYLGFRQATFADPEHQRAVNAHPDFFLTMLNAHQQAYIIALGRLYDTAGDVVHLKSLVDYAVRYPGIFRRNQLISRLVEKGLTREQAAELTRDAFDGDGRALAELNAICEEARGIYMRRAKALRNELVAHTGRAPLAERILPFDQFMVRDLEQIAVLPVLVVQQLRLLFEDGVPPRMPTVTTNIVHVLEQNPGAGPEWFHVQVAKRAQKFVEEYARWVLADLDENDGYHRSHPDDAR